MSVLAELKNRGVADVFFIDCDCEDEGVPFRAVA